MRINEFERTAPSLRAGHQVLRQYVAFVVSLAAPPLNSTFDGSEGEKFLGTFKRPWKDMMSCVLRAYGSAWDPEAFLRDSALPGNPAYRRGEPRSEVRPEGPVNQTSGFHVAASEADFADLPGQIDDAVHFLKKHESELRRLVQFPGVDGVSLDFGIVRRDVVVQSDDFPATLLALMGELGVSLMVSSYPPAQGE